VSHIGQAVRVRRIALKLTQQELADRLGNGTRQTDVSHFEHTGTGLLKWDQLARTLHLSLDEGRADQDPSRAGESVPSTVGATETPLAVSTADATLEGVLRHARQAVALLEQLMEDAQRATHGESNAGGTGDDKPDRGNASN
jgi:transcriptional regulator with XRE-family HTH domain